MLGKVLVTARSFSTSPGSRQCLEEAGCDVVMGPFGPELTEGRLAELCQDADGLVCGVEPITARIIDGAPRLKVIARTGVGYDSVDIVAATRRGIPVGLSLGTNEESVADLAMGLIIDLARHVFEGHDSVRQGGWAKVVGVEVWKKTLAIVGLGRIGKALARRARGFDMHILAVDVLRNEDFAERYGVEYVGLEEALRAADFVSLNAPQLAETERLINERTLALMKPSAYLINTARGGLVDEAALAEAVRTKRIAGAATDVLSEEPPSPGNPLLGVPGIVVLPHLASYSYEAIDRMCLVAAQNVVAVLKGERALFAANPEVYEG